MNEIRQLELAVIAAAQKWRDDVRAGKGVQAEGDNIALLRERVDALTWGCEECNAGGHTCPGDGNSIPHGATDCGQHEHAGAPDASGIPLCPDYGSRLDPCPKDCALGECVYGADYKLRKEQERHLAQLFLECGGEWLKYVEWLDGEQAKIEHCGDSVARVYDSAMRLIGEFRVTASARRLPLQSGSRTANHEEDDGALRDELAAAEQAREEEFIWVPRTWIDVRPGDSIHLPGTESYAYVQHAELQNWHIDPRSNEYRPSALEWSGVKVTIYTTMPDGSRGMATQASEFIMDPAKPIEIKLTPAELAAIELVGWPNRIALIERKS